MYVQSTILIGAILDCHSYTTDIVIAGSNSVPTVCVHACQHSMEHVHKSVPESSMAGTSGALSRLKDIFNCSRGITVRTVD